MLCWRLKNLGGAAFDRAYWESEKYRISVDLASLTLNQHRVEHSCLPAGIASSSFASSQLVVDLRYCNTSILERQRAGSGVLSKDNSAQMSCHKQRVSA